MAEEENLVRKAVETMFWILQQKNKMWLNIQIETMQGNISNLLNLQQTQQFWLVHIKKHSIDWYRGILRKEKMLSIALVKFFSRCKHQQTNAFRNGYWWIVVCYIQLHVHYQNCSVLSIPVSNSWPGCCGLHMALVNLFPHNAAFWCSWETSLLKTLWEKEKLLVTSNFSFSHSVFYLLG